MKICTKISLCLGILGIFVLSTYAEVLAPPPLPPDLGVFRGAPIRLGSQTDTTTPELFTQNSHDVSQPLLGSSWIVLKRFTDASGAPRLPNNTSHNYNYDLGAHLVFWNPAPFSLEGMVRMIITSEHPDWGDSNTWLLNLSSAIIEQNLMVRMALGGGSIELGFHHNSKHDLDRALRRVPIHDTLRLTGFAPRFVGNWGSLPLGWQFTGDLRFEYALEPIFQEEVPEPFAGGIFANLDSDFLILPNGFRFFLNTRLALLANRFNGGSSWDVDWQVRTGLRIPTRTGGLGTFLEVQRLTDDWVNPNSKAPNRNTEPWRLIGIGIMFWQ